MSLLDHAMNILGVCQGEFSLSDIKPGFTVTKVEWNGCMAERRDVVDIGHVVCHLNGQYPFILVDYDKRGKVQEPAAHFRKVNDELEVWS